MQSLSRSLPVGTRKRGRIAQARLTAAYRGTFSGNGTKEDVEIVLADLAAESGYYGVSPADLPADQLKFVEGGRRVFARILASMRMTDAELGALEEAARSEALTTNKEGSL